MLIEVKLFFVEDQKFVDVFFRYIFEYKDKVLLVLDGFDEYNVGEEILVVSCVWMGDEF